jgi:hypothetical protein
MLWHGGRDSNLLTSVTKMSFQGYCLMGCDIVKSGISLEIFQRNSLQHNALRKNFLFRIYFVIFVSVCMNFNVTVIYNFRT